MTPYTVTKRSKLILPVGASMLVLVLVLLISPVGRSFAANTLDWSVKTLDAVADFPCRIVHNIRHFSLSRLDPTCPQCF